MSYHLRSAEPDEIPEICRLICEMSPWTDYEITADVLLKAFQTGSPRQLWVSVSPSGELAGTVSFRVNNCYEHLLMRGGWPILAHKFGLDENEKDRDAPRLPNGAYVHNLAVFPGHQGKGVGEALLHEAERQAREHGDRMFLMVSDFNPRAQKFYERQGYEFLGAIPDCIAPGKAEHVMMKIL